MTDTTRYRIAGETPFVVAEIAAGFPDGGSLVRYGTGFNCSGTNQHEVLQHVRDLAGDRTCVIMRGLSRAKAAAIAMILNAPEEG